MPTDWKRVAIEQAGVAVALICLTVLAVKGVLPKETVVAAIPAALGHLIGLLRPTPTVMPAPSNDNGAP